MHHPIKTLYNRGGKIKMNNKLHHNLNKHIKRVIPHLTHSTNNIRHSLKNMSLGFGTPHMKLPEIVNEYDIDLLPLPKPPKIQEKRKLRPIKFKK